MKVTIKYGKGYEETWAVFDGTTESVKANIVSYFDMSSESVADLSLSDIVVNATAIAHNQGNIVKTLGGTVISAKTASKMTEGETAAPAAEPEPEGPHPLVAQVEAQESVATLQRLWAENKAAFDALPDLMAAYRAKGKALQEAGAL